MNNPHVAAAERQDSKTELETAKLHATIATALDGAFRGGGTLKVSPPKVTITVVSSGVEMKFSKVDLAALLRGLHVALCEARAVQRDA